MRRVRPWHALLVIAGVLVLVVVEIVYLPRLVMEPTEWGSLWAITDPPVPAAISVDGKPRGAWGIWTDLPVGPHRVCFGPATDYTAPPCRTVAVTRANMTRVTGTYTSTKGSLRVTTSPAEPAMITVDGVPRSKWGVWTDLPVGPHSVCFGPVRGHTAPPCQDITINPGSLITVTGQYT